MMKSRFFMPLVAMVISGLLFTGCSEEDDDNNNNQNDTPTLAGLVSGDARFSILADALSRTGLDVTLDGSGSFTVFAPNDAAFAALFSDLGVADLDEALNTLGEEAISNILLYHVLNAEVRAADVTTGYVSSLGVNERNNALSIYINVGSTVELNGIAAVETTDLEASNGVAHEIDAVITPLNIYQLIEVNENFSSLEAALGLADGNLDLVLSDNTAYTLFAPDNEAFNDLVAATPGVNDLGELVAALGTDVLANVLLYHVVVGEVRADDLSTGNVTTAASTVMTGSLSFFVNLGMNGSVTIVDGSASTNDANVTQTDITGTNGAVHFLDNVLLPL